MSARLDTSDLDRLNAKLVAAGQLATTETIKIVSATTKLVEAEARRNAQARRRTGELAASVTSDVRGFTGTVSANPRQAYFLEYGSPNTGPPDPWMSGPASRAQETIMAQLDRFAKRAL